jgi:hypothetical protein
MKKILLIFVTIFLCASVTRAEIPKEKRQEIQKMLRLTGMEKLMNQMKVQMISSMKQQMPKVQEEFWDKFEKKMDMSELVEKIIPLYDKYYTLEDLKAVNAFYESAAGQKVLSSLPQIMRESMKIGQEWGAKIGEEAEREAKQELKNK